MGNEDHDIIYLIKELNKEITLDFDKRLLEHGLTGCQGRLLFYLMHEKKEGKIIHQKDIENVFRLSKSTVSGMISRLEKGGFLKRAEKRPYIEIEIEQKAYDVADSIHANKNKSIDKLLAGFDETKQIEIKEYLNKLIKNMREGEL